MTTLDEQLKIEAGRPAKIPNHGKHIAGAMIFIGAGYLYTILPDNAKMWMALAGVAGILIAWSD